MLYPRWDGEVSVYCTLGSWFGSCLGSHLCFSCTLLLLELHRNPGLTKRLIIRIVLPCGVVPGECCALWYTGFTVKSSDFGTSGTRPSGPISILSKAESSRFTGSFGEDCCFGESLKVKEWWKHMFWEGLGREVAWYSWISLLHLSTKADIQLKPLNDTVKAVWDGTRSLWIHWWMKSGWIFWEFEFVWASAIGEFLSFRQPDFTMATVATLVFRELYVFLF